MELEQEKVDLIKKIILSDKKYTDNEDMFEDFLNETYKRSFLIMKTIKNEAALEAYLKKIVTTSIITVLKDSGRLRRTTEGFIPTNEASLDEIAPKPQEKHENKYANVQISYDIVDLGENPEEIVIKKEIQQKLYDAVTIANNLNPTKQFLDLYHLRYEKGLKQKEIAKKMNLSQSEVSKRLIELIEEVKAAFNKSM